jgi:hypothetical protein
MLGDNEVYQNNIQQAQQPERIPITVRQREYDGWRFDDDGDHWNRQPVQPIQIHMPQRPERIHWDALNSRIEHIRRLSNSSQVDWTHLTSNPNAIHILEQPAQQEEQPVQQEEQPVQQEEQPVQQEEQEEQEEQEQEEQEEQEQAEQEQEQEKEEPRRRYIDRYISGVRLINRVYN